MNWNLDEIRDWIRHRPASPKIKRMRVNLFDIYRYQEDYEKIYQMVQDLTQN
jgi:hypothetical protein